MPTLPRDEKLDQSLKRALLLMAWMLIAAGLVGGAWLLLPLVRWALQVLSPFLVALVVAYIFNPIVNFLQHKLKLGRQGGIVVAALLVVLVVLAFFGLLIPVLYTQTSNLIQAVRDALPDLVEVVGRRLSPDRVEEIKETVLKWVEEADFDPRRLMGHAAQAAESGARAFQGAVVGMGSFVGGVFGFFAAAILAVVIAFYYLMDFNAIPGLLRSLCPVEHEARFMEILGKVDRAVGGFLRGQLIVCSLVALLASIGLALVGMRQYAVLVGVLAGAANIIPYLGPVMGATPAVLWALLSPTHETWPERLTFAGIVLALFAIIQTLDGLLFQPRIVGRSSQLHPLVVMLALVVGAQFGLVGMILAVPSACVIRVLFLELWWKKRQERRAQAAEANSKSAASII
jgi:predicted PurR-regulated permease PerM